MAIDADAVWNHSFPAIEQTYTARDVVLYALGIGLGQDPLDQGDLDYLIETRTSVLPTFAATLASPGLWIRDPVFGVDFARLVHAEQAMVFHHALPPKTTVVATPRVSALHDRGAGRGAVLVVERDITDVSSGTRYATARQTLLLRGDGGFGGPPTPASRTATPPERVPDAAANIPVSPRAALIYRLSGDWNPLHCDPDFAADAGFARPILHGLASYGMAAHATMRAFDADLASFTCRFAGVVYPGDELAFSFWREGEIVLFTASSAGRTVLDRGVATLR